MSRRGVSRRDVPLHMLLQRAQNVPKTTRVAPLTGSSNVPARCAEEEQTLAFIDRVTSVDQASAVRHLQPYTIERVQQYRSIPLVEQYREQCDEQEPDQQREIARNTLSCV